MTSQLLAEGLVMGILGYTMTFVILIILSVAMYVTSKIVSRTEKQARASTPKQEVVPAPAAQVAELSPEEAVAVATAIHALLTEALPQAPTPAPSLTGGWRLSPWVIKARLDTRIYLGDLTYIRKRRSSEVRRG